MRSIRTHAQWVSRCRETKHDRPASVAEHIEEMTERGADQKGEGRVP